VRLFGEQCDVCHVSSVKYMSMEVKLSTDRVVW
jgi:hypothetical protein